MAKEEEEKQEGKKLVRLFDGFIYECARVCVYLCASIKAKRFGDNGGIDEMVCGVLEYKERQ